MLTRLAMRSLCVLAICSFWLFPILVLGGVWVPIALVPGHCMLVQ